MNYIELSKLIVCSQPLYDRTISELRAENEELKLRLFWAKNTTKLLRSLIKEHIISKHCICYNCRMVKNEFNYITMDRCEWRDEFEAKLHELGITFSGGVPNGWKDYYGLITLSSKDHLCSGISGEWGVFVGYGEKFKTKDWNELNKLTSLFSYMWKDIIAYREIVFNHDLPHEDEQMYFEDMNE